MLKEAHKQARLLLLLPPPPPPPPLLAALMRTLACGQCHGVAKKNQDEINTLFQQ
jgi:hypothetical protein